MNKNRKQTMQLHLIAISGAAPFQKGEIASIDPSKIHIVLWDEILPEHRRFIFENILGGDDRNMTSNMFGYIVDYLSSIRFFKGEDVLCSPFSSTPDRQCIRSNARFIGCVLMDPALGDRRYFIDGMAVHSKLYDANMNMFSLGKLLSAIDRMKRKKEITDSLTG